MDKKNMLKDWPILDMLDFEMVTFDATLWDDKTYTLMVNFYEPNDLDEPPFSGYSMCTQLNGDSLEELYEKISLLIEIGLFDGTEVGAIGTLWDEEGEELEEINWLSFEEDIDEDLLTVPKGVTIQ